MYEKENSQMIHHFIEPVMFTHQKAVQLTRGQSELAKFNRPIRNYKLRYTVYVAVYGFFFIVNNEVYAGYSRNRNTESHSKETVQKIIFVSDDSNEANERAPSESIIFNRYIYDSRQ